MSTRDLLDDLAAAETAGLGLDLAAVRREAAVRDRRRSGRRRASAAAVLAAAAVVALLAVLIPGTSLHRTAEPAAPVPTGLPATWHHAPSWTPPITRRPMAAAVMVLGTPLETGSLADRRRFASAPVLLSADGRTYARLPNWSADDGGVSLSPDGRRVAWWTASRAGDDANHPRPPTRRLQIHLLRTADPEIRTVSLPVALPDSMVWTGPDVVVSGRIVDADGPEGLSGRTWRIDGRTGTVRQVCACTGQVLGVTASGGLLQARPPSGVSALHSEPDVVPGATEVNAAQFWRSQGPADLRGFMSPRLKADPRGRFTADVEYQAWVGERSQWAVVAQGYQRIGSAMDRTWPNTLAWPVSALADEPVLSATVIGWVEGGILVAVDTRSGSTIRLLDPATRSVRVVSRGPAGAPSATSPVAVATALVGDAAPRSVPQPDRPLTDRSHLAFLAARHVDVLIGVGVILALAVGIPLHRRLRRRTVRGAGGSRAPRRAPS